MIIHKFPLIVAPEQHVEMPRQARILSVQVQRDTICLWALVDPEAQKEHRTFRIVATGKTVDSDEPGAGVYLGTVQLEGGQFVFHVFEYLVAVRAT